jgi:hypothetical protein
MGDAMTADDPVTEDAEAPASDDTPATTAPAGDLLDAVLHAYDELLGGPTLADDDFFALGGTSLVAARLVTALASAVGRQLRTVDVLRSRTPRLIAQRLAAAPVLAEPVLPTAPPSAEQELSPPQRWYSRVYRDALEGAVMAFVLTLPDEVSADAAWAAVHQVVARHDALRTSVTERDGRLVQVPAPLHTGPASQPPSWGTTVRVVGDADAVTAEAAAACARIEARGIPVDGGPLLRAILLRGTDPGTAVPVQLAVVVSHLVFDGASIAVLERDLSAALGGPAAWTSAATSYRDYTAWRLSRESPDTREAERVWWSRRLAGVGSWQLPLRDAAEEPAGYASQVTLPADTVRAVATYASRESVPVSAVRTAAFLVACHALYDTDEMVVGMPVEVREHPALRDAVGMYVNHALVRHRKKDRETVRELVQDVAKELLSVAQARDRPFDVAMDVAPERCHSGRFPITGAVINAVDVDTPDGPRVEEVRTQALSRVRISDLQLNFIDAPDQVDVQVRHRSDTLAAQDGVQLLRCVMEVLGALTGPAPGAVAALTVRAREVLSHRMPSG